MPHYFLTVAPPAILLGGAIKKRRDCASEPHATREKKPLVFYRVDSQDVADRLLEWFRHANLDLPLPGYPDISISALEKRHNVFEGAYQPAFGVVDTAILEKAQKLAGQEAVELLERIRAVGDMDPGVWADAGLPHDRRTVLLMGYYCQAEAWEPDVRKELATEAGNRPVYLWCTYGELMPLDSTADMNQKFFFYKVDRVDLAKHLHSMFQKSQGAALLFGYEYGSDLDAGDKVLAETSIAKYRNREVTGMDADFYATAAEWEGQLRKELGLPSCVATQPAPASPQKPPAVAETGKNIVERTERYFLAAGGIVFYQVDSMEVAKQLLELFRRDKPAPDKPFSIVDGATLDTPQRILRRQEMTLIEKEQADDEYVDAMNAAGEPMVDQSDFPPGYSFDRRVSAELMSLHHKGHEWELLVRQELGIPERKASGEAGTQDEGGVSADAGKGTPLDVVPPGTEDDKTFLQRLLDAPSPPCLNAIEMARLQAYLKRPVSLSMLGSAARGEPNAVKERDRLTRLKEIRAFNKALAAQGAPSIRNGQSRAGGQPIAATGWQFANLSEQEVRAQNQALCREYATMDMNDLLLLCHKWRGMAVGFVAATKRTGHYHGHIVHDADVDKVTKILATAIAAKGIEGVSRLARCLRRPDDSHLHYALATLDELEARLRAESMPSTPATSPQVAGSPSPNVTPPASKEQMAATADNEPVAPPDPAAQPVPPPDGKVVKARHNVAAKRSNHTSIELRGDPSRYVPPPDDSRRVISTVGAGEMVWVIYESVTPSDVVAYWKETERQLGELRAKVEADSGNPHVDPFPYYVGRDALQLLEAVMQEREAAASGDFDKQNCYTFLQAYMARLKALTDELSFCLEAWATPRPARQHVVEFSGASGVFALDALGKRLGQLVDDYQNGMARYIAKTANPGPSGSQGGLRKVYSCPYNEDLWRVADAVAWPARADLSKIQAELELDLQLLKQPAASVPSPSAPPQAQEPQRAGTAGDAEKKGTQPGRAKRWTQSWCPSCGRAPIEFISASAFEKKTRKDGKTVGREAVGRRIAKGEYWHNGRKEVPWCEHCRAQTPLGRGVEKPVDAVPKYRPSQIESGQAFAWCAELVAKTFRLPKPDIDLPPDQDADRDALAAYEYANEGVRAILEDAALRGGMPSRDEAEKVALAAIQEYRDKDFKSRKYESHGDMEHPAQKPEVNDE